MILDISPLYPFYGFPLSPQNSLQVQAQAHWVASWASVGSLHHSKGDWGTLSGVCGVPLSCAGTLTALRFPVTLLTADSAMAVGYLLG